MIGKENKMNLLEFNFIVLAVIAVFFLKCSVAVEDAVNEGPPERIQRIAGSSVVLSWCVNSSPPPAVSFILKNPDGATVEQRTIVKLTEGGDVIKLPGAFDIKRLFSKTQIDVLKTNCSVSENTLRQNYSLVIRNLSVSQGRIYQIYVNNGVSTFLGRFETQLEIFDAPTFAVNKTHQTKVLRRGATLTEVCSVVSDLPMAVKWFRGGNKLKEGLNSSVLNIENISRTHSGVYSCLASNELSEIWRWVNVSVIYPPENLTISPMDVRSFVGQTVTLYCDSEGNPSPSIHWLTPRRHSSRQAGRRLVVRFNSSDDFGNYTCVAVNSLGQQNLIQTITELFPPGKVDFVRNDTGVRYVRLEWRVPAFNGGSNVTAYSITVNGKGNYSTNGVSFDINNLSKNTSYVFCVRAINKVGMGEENCINLTTLYEGPPESPKINVTWSRENIVIVYWTSVGNNVTYTLRYRQKDVQEWTKINWTDVSGFSSLNYTLQDLEFGITYEIQMSARNTGGSSLPSNTETVQIPEIPSTSSPDETTTISDGPSSSDGTSRTGSSHSTIPMEQQSSDNTMSAAIIAVSVVLVFLVIAAVVLFVLWLKRRSVTQEQQPGEQLSGYVAGPVNGDLYTTVNHSNNAKKKQKFTSDLMYAELSELVPAEESRKPPAYQPTDYADISHVLSPVGDVTYSNVEPRCAQEGDYANVQELDV